MNNKFNVGSEKAKGKVWKVNKTSREPKKNNGRMFWELIGFKYKSSSINFLIMRLYIFPSLTRFTSSFTAHVRDYKKEKRFQLYILMMYIYHIYIIWFFLKVNGWWLIFFSFFKKDDGYHWIFISKKYNIKYKIHILKVISSLLLLIFVFFFFEKLLIFL